MSSDDGLIQLCLSLFYTPLPQFSLLHYTPALNKCDINGKQLLCVCAVNSCCVCLFTLIHTFSSLTVEAGVLYIHVHSARNLSSIKSGRSNCDPFCVVRQEDRMIFKTGLVVGSTNPVWEKGLEILIPSCRDAHFSFDVYNGRGKSHDNLLGYAQVNLEMVNVFFE